MGTAEKPLSALSSMMLLAKSAPTAVTPSSSSSSNTSSTSLGLLSLSILSKAPVRPSSSRMKLDSTVCAGPGVFVSGETSTSRAGWDGLDGVLTVPWLSAFAGCSCAFTGEVERLSALLFDKLLLKDDPLFSRSSVQSFGVRPAGSGSVFRRTDREGDFKFRSAADNGVSGAAITNRI